MPREKPYVVVSCPSDLQEYRNKIRDVHSEYSKNYGPLEYDLYNYDKEIDLSPPTDDVPAQERLNKAVIADECIAVIGIVSERLGTNPKPDAEVLKKISFAAGTDKVSGFLHPWPQSGSEKEQAALEKGHFPLTGTTGEILLAQAFKKKLRVYFIGSPNILSEDDLEEVDFGTAPVFRQGEAANGGLHHQDFNEWLEKEYLPDLRAVRNFLKYLNDSNRFGWVPDTERIRPDLENFERGVRRFYETEMNIISPRIGRRLFKGLSSYSIDDSEIFFGRGAWIKTRLSQFSEIDAQDASASLLVITGESGSGKSSVLQAGLAARLRDTGDFTPILFYPHELISREPVQTIAYIIERICEEMRTSLTSLDRQKLTGCSRANIIPKGMEVLKLSLRERYNRPLLVLDQFEEVVVAATENADAGARAAMEFIRAVLRPGTSVNAAAIAAIKNHYKSNLWDSDVFGSLVSESVLCELRLPTSDELIEIASAPYYYIGASFDSSAQALIKARLTKFLKGAGKEGDVLPLISLELTRLYDAVSPKVDRILRRRRRLPESAPPKITEREVAEHVDFENAINRLADEAINEVRNQPGLVWDEKKLDYLFLRLIALKPQNNSDDNRMSMLLTNARLSEEMSLALSVASALKKRRLIVETGVNTFQLVHEAVARKWSRFYDWLERATESLKGVRLLEPLRELYEAREVSERQEFLAAPTFRKECLIAARVLVDYSDLLATQQEDSISPVWRARREFYLELIAVHPTLACEFVESVRDATKKKDDPATLVPVGHIPCIYGRSDILARYLELDPGLVSSVRMPEHRSILVPAIVADDEKTMEVLFDYGVDPLAKETEGDGWSPITAAAYIKNLNLFKRLIDLGADPVEKLAAGWSTLHLCAQQDADDLLRFILSSVDKDKISNAMASERGYTPATIAAQYGHINILKSLYEFCPELVNRPLGPKRAQPLHFAVASGNAELVKWLASCPEVDVNTTALEFDGRSPIHIAAELGAGGEEVIRALLNSERCQPDLRFESGDNSTPLHMAAKCGNQETVQWLLNHSKVDPNAQDSKDKTPLFVAMEEKNYQIVDTLLDDERVDPGIDDSEGRTVLFLANQAEDINRLQRMLARLPANAQVSDAQGWTPLLYAAAHGLREEMDRFLAEREGEIRDLVIQGEENQPADLVCFAVHQSKTQWLQRFLADERITPNRGWDIALATAAKRPDLVHILELLLADSRFQPNSVCQGDDQKPVHCAAMTGNLTGLKQLALYPSVDLLAEDGWGRTVLDIAPLSVRDEISEMANATGAPDNLSGSGARNVISTFFQRFLPIFTAKPAVENNKLEEGGKSLTLAEKRGVSTRTSNELSDAAQGLNQIEELTASEQVWLIQQMPVIDGMLKLDETGTIFRKRRYSFYPEYTIVEVNNENWPTGKSLHVYLAVTGELSDDNEIVRLDGTSPPIHYLNLRGKIVLNIDTVLDYLKFFCFFVHGEEGPFYVIPKPESDIYVSQDVYIDPGESGRYGTLEYLYRPPAIHRFNKADGSYFVSGLIYYSDAIFHADFRVMPNGFIEMIEDEQLISGLGVKVNVPSMKLHSYNETPANHGFETLPANFLDMMKQAKVMQGSIEDMASNLAEMQIPIASRSGLVEGIVSGKQEVMSLRVDRDVKDSDIELEVFDFIMEMHNNVDQIVKKQTERMLGDMMGVNRQIEG